MVPVAPAALEHLDPAAAGPPPVGAVAAAVALAQPQQPGPALPVDAAEALQALVGGLQGEVEPGPAQVGEVAVVLLDLGHEPPPAGLRLDQDVVASGDGVVGDVLEPGPAAPVLADQAVAGRAGRQLGRDPADVGPVVEHHVEAVLPGQDAAGLQPPAGRRRKQGGQLGLPLQDEPPRHPLHPGACRTRTGRCRGSRAWYAQTGRCRGSRAWRTRTRRNWGPFWEGSRSAGRGRVVVHRPRGAVPGQPGSSPRRTRPGGRGVGRPAGSGRCRSASARSGRCPRPSPRRAAARAARGRCATPRRW